jgi:Tfp pilus assembly protein FimT
MDSRPSQSNSPQAPRAGVSLLAVLVTLAAIALIAGLAIPAFFDRHGVTLNNACDLVARDLRVAQNWASYSQAEFRFVFDADGDGYKVVDADGVTVARPDQKGAFSRRFSIDAVFDGVHLEQIGFGPERSVCFDRHGKARTGGSVEVTFRGQSHRLTLQQNTGRVTVDGLEPTWDRPDD